MGCPTSVAPWQAYTGTLSGHATADVTIIGATGSPVPAGATIVFCRLVAKATSVDSSTALVMMDHTFSLYYSTVWCQVANLNIETLGFCALDGGHVYLKNFGATNSITAYLYVLGYS